MRPPGYDNINSSAEDQYLSCSGNPGNFGRFDTEAGICSLCGKIPRAHMQMVRKRLSGGGLKVAAALEMVQRYTRGQS